MKLAERRKANLIGSSRGKNVDLALEGDGELTGPRRQSRIAATHSYSRAHPSLVPPPFMAALAPPPSS
ncbi:unnamed protein product [Prunus armeniaca]|uniref:Uncharacterized protein n=1 Tax=Prunus armeniaca TaxID=36596 RepID=A0A6J5Y6Q8_PRUAR|nr:unnamed protein product [Prunus armeniaca]